MAPVDIRAARDIVDKWMDKETIGTSDSDYSSALKMFRKSNDTYNICIDYRDVNAPAVDTILDDLRGTSRSAMARLLCYATCSISRLALSAIPA